MTTKEINYQIESSEFHIQELERQIEEIKANLKENYNHIY